MQVDFEPLKGMNMLRNITVNINEIDLKITRPL